MAYTKVSIPKELVEKIRRIIEESGYGYRSVQEFVIEAVRLRIIELEEKIEESHK